MWIKTKTNNENNKTSTIKKEKQVREILSNRYDPSKATNRLKWI